MTIPQILRQVPDSGSGGSISDIASPSGDAAPAETSSPAAGGSSEQSVEEVLRFDMFAPPEKPKPAEAQPAQAPGQPAPAAAAQPATPTPATPPGDLERLLATQTAQINEVLRRQQEASRPAQQAAPAAAAPRFQVGVPPQLVQMLRSEDQEEVGRGVHALVNGVSNMVWDAVQEHIQKEVLGQIPLIVQQQYSSRQEVQSIESDFYGRYQHVANDAFRPIIQQIGLQLIQDLAARGLPTHYTPQIGDIIIQRLHALIPQLGPVPTAGMRQPASAPAAKPKLNGAGGTRPSSTPSLADDILGTIRS